ncbi:MAG: 50S ribosomal protein L32, partial [Candidatus Moranbacteria bacterium]|nr:50S ribosomal protein L32 [Candidatus Moranbacteria bacterium]
GAPALSHRVCPTCGTYKGRTVIDTTPKRKTVAAAKA